MSVPSRTLAGIPLLAGALLLAGAVPALAAPSAAAPPSAAGTAAIAGYLQATGRESGGAQLGVPLPPEQVFLTTTGSASISHSGPGEYVTFFHGLPLDGMATTVRSTDGGQCQAFQVQLPLPVAATQVGVRCTDLAGVPTDHAFTVAVTDGHTSRGGLATALLSAPTSTSVTVPAPQTSSVGGTTTAQRTAKGAWTLRLPRLPGTAPLTVSLSPVGRTPAVCAVSGTSVTGSVQEVRVRCRGALGVGPVDVPVQVVTARDVDVLGASDLSTAYAKVARSTAAARVLPASAARNVFAGVDRPVAVRRAGPGRYSVDLPGQVGSANPTYAVTALGSPSSCLVVGTSVVAGAVNARRLDVTCESATGVLVDSGFHLQYADQQ